MGQLGDRGNVLWQTIKSRPREAHDQSAQSLVIQALSLSCTDLDSLEQNVVDVERDGHMELKQRTSFQTDYGYPEEFTGPFFSMMIYFRMP
jgi:hypothetical protein